MRMRMTSTGPAFHMCVDGPARPQEGLPCSGDRDSDSGLWVFSVWPCGGALPSCGAEVGFAHGLGLERKSLGEAGAKPPRLDGGLAFGLCLERLAPASRGGPRRPLMNLNSMLLYVLTLRLCVAFSARARIGRSQLFC